MRRFGAYIIDLFIILLATNIIGYFLPNSADVSDIYEDSESFIEEYYDAIMNQSSNIDELSEQLNDYTYELNKAGIYTNLMTVVIYFLYFIIFQSYNNGQTVGKKILKIEVENIDGKDVSLRQLLIRSILIFPIAYTLLDIILILIASKNVYLTISSYLILIRYLIFLISGIMVIFSGRGLHDRLAKTIVVDINQNDNDSKVNKWKENAEKEKNIKQNYKNHMRGNIKGKKE